MRSNIAVISGIIILLLVNWSIAGKEKHLKEGKIVFLELAPVDPRSLMQGDYMRLRFALANEVYRNLPKSDKKHGWRRNNLKANDGKVVVRLDEKNIATFSHLENEAAQAGNELLLRYRVRNGQVKFATNAFFFEEGKASAYQKARYGKFRVDASGELLLTSMYDKNLNKLEAIKKKTK